MLRKEEENERSTLASSKEISAEIFVDKMDCIQNGIVS